MISPIGRKPSRSGYTLIELILLTVIIAILIGISTPLFRRTFSDLEIKDASFNISRLISFAQERAVVEGTPFKLVLDVKKARYYLTREDPSAPGKYIRLKEKLGRVFELPRGIKLKADKKVILFYPDGHSDKAAIRLLRGDESLKITLKGNLGYVKIEGGH